MHAHCAVLLVCFPSSVASVDQITCGFPWRSMDEIICGASGPVYSRPSVVSIDEITCGAPWWCMDEIICGASCPICSRPSVMSINIANLNEFIVSEIKLFQLTFFVCMWRRLRDGPRQGRTNPRHGRRARPKPASEEGGGDEDEALGGADGASTGQGSGKCLTFDE